MEHCGDDFLAALADAMQDTEDWEDLEAIETEACGTLSKIIETKVSNDHGVGTQPASARSGVGKERSHGHSPEEALKRLSSSIDDEDSDLEVLSQMNGHSFNSNRKQGQTSTQALRSQPLISTVGALLSPSCIRLCIPSFVFFLVYNFFDGKGGKSYQGYSSFLHILCLEPLPSPLLHPLY